jgi:serine/threonine-protein kinase
VVAGVRAPDLLVGARKLSYLESSPPTRMEQHSRIQLDVSRGDILDGKYRVERVLGCGGMGVVIAAYHLGLKQMVAIKFLLPEALEDPEAAERFSREARAAAKIKGEHIARIMDVGTLENGSPYMVMEYLEGEDLAAKLRRERGLPIAEAVELVLQTCEVVAEAHSLGIVHRDLKPANLFCLNMPDGTVSIKVLDFGISKVVGPNTSHTLTLTKTSALVGSPSYMSPEQIQSPRNVDARTDIWSLGVVLFECLAGKGCFRGKSPTEICLKVLKRRPPPIRRLRPEVPEEIEAIVQRCLSKNRTDRFSSVSELSQALAPFGADRAKLSAGRIAAIGKSRRSVATLPPSPEKRPSLVPRHAPRLPWWKAFASRITGKKPRRSQTPFAERSDGALAALALALLGLALVSFDLLSSKRAARTAPAPADSSSLAASPTPAIQALAASAQLTAAAPLSSATEPGNAPAPDVDCQINFLSVPSATLVLDGRKVGPTPRLALATSPGAHVVVFEHPSRGKVKTTVDCKGGETKTVSVQLGRAADGPANGSSTQANRTR